jgi:hypothetical protein
MLPFDYDDRNYTDDKYAGKQAADNPSESFGNCNVTTPTET